MKKVLSCIVVMLLMLFYTGTVYGVTYPDHKGLVNDYTNTLSSDQTKDLETYLREYEKKSTNEIAVAIVPDLQGENVDMYTVGLFEKWGIGKKGKDNGVLLLIAKKERKWRIEVGYGLEGVLNDGKCGDIARSHIVPSLKKGDYYTGIKEGLAQVIRHLEIANVAPTAGPVPKSDGNTEATIAFIILLSIAGVVGIILLIVWWAEKKDEEKLSHPIDMIPMPPTYTLPTGSGVPHKTGSHNSHRHSDDDDDSYSSRSSSSDSSNSSFGGFDFGGGGSGGAGASGGF